MSVIRPRPPEDPIAYSVEGGLGDAWEPGVPGDQLEAIRNAIVCDPGGAETPRRWLDEYGTRRAESRLFEVLAEARRIRDSVDRLVIVSDGAVGAATRLLAASCCHPFHDQLPRGDRGGRPRLSWLDAGAEDDRIHGLLDVVAPEGRPPSRDLLDQWAILAVSVTGDEPPIGSALERLVAALERASRDSSGAVSERLVVVSKADGVLASWARAFGIAARFQEASDVDSSHGVLSTAALLASSIAGINVVRLLEGADAMLVRFAEAPLAANPVLINAAARHDAARKHGLEKSLFTGGGVSLAGFSEWMQHVRPAAPEAASFVTHLVVEEPRRGDPGQPLVVSQTAPASHVTIRLPRLDEHALGQLLELMILSAMVEKRLRNSL